MWTTGIGGARRATLLLAFLLLGAAVILMIVYLQPGTREPEGRPPGQASPTASPSGSPASEHVSADLYGDERADGGDGGRGAVECVLTDSGQGSQIDCPKNFTMEGSAAGLFPGATVQLSLTITNPNEEDVRVTAVTVAVAATSNSSCSTSFLDPTNYAGPGFVVPGNGSNAISLPLTMSRDAPDACQNVTFTLSYGGKAETA